MADETAAFIAYNNQLKQIQEQARQFVERSMASFFATHKGPTPESIKSAGQECLSYAFQYYGDMGAVAACRQFDAMVRQHALNVNAAQMFSDVDDGYIEYVVSDNQDLIYDGNIKGFTEKLALAAHDKPRRQANRTMTKNARRRGAWRQGVRYARVPSGKETCGFCLTMASLGFVYHSRSSAGDFTNRYHARCDCTVWASTDAAKIEGYDPDALYEVYRDARETIGATNSTKELSQICKEIERRRRTWAYSGKKPSVTLSEKAKATGVQKRMAEVLSAHGIKVDLKRSRMSTSACVARMNGAIYEIPSIMFTRSGEISEYLSGAKRSAVLDVTPMIERGKKLEDIVADIEMVPTEATEVVLIAGDKIRRIFK